MVAEPVVAVAASADGSLEPVLDLPVLGYNEVHGTDLPVMDPPVQRERSSEMERSLTSRMEAARQQVHKQSAVARDA